MDIKKVSVAGLLVLILGVAGLEVKYLVESKNIQIDKVVDGDTVIMKNGKSVRLLGINAPDRGEEKYTEADRVLQSMIKDKKIWLESDRYPEDMYGRTLSWMWIECETEPKFVEFDYMKLSKNRSKPGLAENPEGCRQGRLVNEEMVKLGMARLEFYKDRGEMKYQRRLEKLKKTAESF